MTVAIRLEPYESQFLVFADSALRAHLAPAAAASNGAGAASGAIHRS